MGPPEMSYSPAYYQDHGHLVTADNRPSIPPTPPAAHLPCESSSSPRNQQQQQQQHGAIAPRPSDSDRFRTPQSHDYTSDMWDPSFAKHSGRASADGPYPAQGPVETVYPDFAQPAAVPVTSGAMRKEERLRGSMTDHSSHLSSDNHPSTAFRAHKRVIRDEDSLADDNQDALLMLLRLSAPVPIFSFAACIYTLFGLFFVILVSPLRLCSCIPYFRATTFRAQLCDLLVPQLHIHERLVRMRKSPQRSSRPQSAYNNLDRQSKADSCASYSVGGLIAVLLLSSLLSIAFLLLAWTAAFFWIFAMVLGNPDGTERKDDGRAAVLGVCRWWQTWLRRARKRRR
ncbi:uncharacterized protein BDW47DRAFT_13772 [Aspergillus candidus]|uniref:Uncharacterized protein n=1 Tax=Aspergillus candidus TaxID=41067 RepID=A0A2I2FFY9_ASPCN|nr:hypothetical protein BDW47DRAFT_13772 [Aspergillus candidus]PLB39544.1 hypothetical protein BDW47DRAFT_13772 [Aspergillus candidus]